MPWWDDLNLDDDDEEREPLSRRALIWFFELFPGLASPVVVFCSLLALALSVVVFGLALFILSMGGLISCFWIGAAGGLLFWTSLSWVMYGSLAHPVEAMADFQEKHWIVLFLASCGLIGAFVLFAKSLK
jgi:hypothetical protein